MEKERDSLPQSASVEHDKRFPNLTLRMGLASVKGIRLEANGVYGLSASRFVELLWLDYVARGVVLDLRLGRDRDSRVER